MRKILIFIIASILFIFVGCNTVKFEPYNGMPLTIGVIGEAPEIKENVVKFNEIEFTDLENQDILKQYDAIFITKDNLAEAAKERYKSIYNKSTLLIFFIGNEKGHVPFTIEDLSYEDVPNSGSQSYATGILFNNGEFKSWEYGLYNDTKTKKSIEDMYSGIFNTISEVRDQK